MWKVMERIMGIAEQCFVTTANLPSQKSFTKRFRLFCIMLVLVKIKIFLLRPQYLRVYVCKVHCDFTLLTASFFCSVPIQIDCTLIQGCW